MKTSNPAHRLIAIDPGARFCGVALFVGGALVRAERIPPDHAAPWLNADHVAIESMWSRPGEARSQPNDLLSVQASGFALAGRLCAWSEITAYYPHQWKGSTPKKIHQKRIISRLTDEEKSALPRLKTHLRDALDAVGIGMHHLRKQRS